MAGENTEPTSLPEIYKMQTWDLNAEKLKANDKNGDGKLGWRERRQANRWIKNESHTARDLFDSNQRDLFLKSVQAHRAAALARQAAVSPTVVEEPEKPVVDAAALDVPDEQVTPVVRTPVATNWAKVATDNGFTSIDDVKNFQTRMGLTVDGKAGKDTLAAKQWYDTMKGNGYTEVSTNGNPTYFMHGNNKFYLNGTSVIGGGSGTYDYTKMQKIVAQPTLSPTQSTISASQPIIPPSSNITEDQFRNSKYFRHHALGRKYIEIGGKKYPMMVTRNIEKNHPLGLLNDQTYVLDLDTGKLRAVYETTAGLVSNNMFDKNSKWIDASNLFTEEQTHQNEAQSNWQAWLAANPKPINNFTQESRRASLQWEKAYNEKRKELGFQRQGGQLISKKAKGGGLTKKYFTGGQAHVGVSIPLNKPKNMRVSVGGQANFGKVNQSVEASVQPFRKNWNVGSSTRYSSGNTSISMPISLGGNSKGIQNWRVSPNFNIADSKRNINHSLALGLSGNKQNSFLDANYSTSQTE